MTVTWLCRTRIGGPVTAGSVESPRGSVDRMRAIRARRLLTPFLVGLIGLVSTGGVAADAGTATIATRVGHPPPFHLMPGKSISALAPTGD